MTTGKPRTLELEKVENAAAALVFSEHDEKVARALIQRAYALGGASRASPEAPCVGCAKLREDMERVQHAFGLAGRIAKDKIDALRASPEEGRWRSAVLSLGKCPACRSSFRDACTMTPKQRGCALCAPSRLLLMGAEIAAVRSPASPEEGRLREALFAEWWERAWTITLRTLAASDTKRTDDRRRRGWWHKANARRGAAEKRVEAARAALRSPPAPAEERGQGDSEDEITRCLNTRFRNGIEAAARILAGKGIDCRGLLDIRDPDTLTEIAKTLATTQPPAPPTEDEGAREECGAHEDGWADFACTRPKGHDGEHEWKGKVTLRPMSAPASSKEGHE